MQHADATEWLLSDDASSRVAPETPHEQHADREAAAEFKRLERCAERHAHRLRDRCSPSARRWLMGMSPRQARKTALYRATVRPRAARAYIGSVVGRRPCVAPRAPRRAAARRAVPAARGDDPPPGPPPPASPPLTLAPPPRAICSDGFAPEVDR